MEKKGSCGVYMKVIVSWLGACLSRHPGAYKYLVFSAIHFYPPSEVSGLLAGAGFRKTRFIPLFAGVAGITVAIK